MLNTDVFLPAHLSWNKSSEHVFGACISNLIYEVKCASNRLYIFFVQFYIYQTMSHGHDILFEHARPNMRQNSWTNLFSTRRFHWCQWKTWVTASTAIANRTLTNIKCENISWIIAAILWYHLEFQMLALKLKSTRYVWFGKLLQRSSLPTTSILG